MEPLPGRSDRNGDKHPPEKRKRQHYKQYLSDPSIPIPRTTLNSRNKKLRDAAVLMEQHAVDHIEEPATEQPPLEEPDLGIPLPTVVGDETAILQPTMEAGEEESASHYDPLPEPEITISQPQNIQDGGNMTAGKEKGNVNYVVKYNLNNRLHQAFSVTRLEVLLMILHLAVRHCHTQSFIEDQIKFVNVLFDDNVLDVSYYIFKNLFKTSTKICKHYFCPACDLYLGSQDDFDDSIKYATCEKCKNPIDVRSVTSGNYFIMLPLRDQIEELLKKPNVKIIPNSKRFSVSGIADIFDGEQYKKLLGLGFPEHILTLTFNTDGVEVHNSTKNSLWPIFAYINEICPEERFKTENLILAGLWFGPSAPSMSLYLKPFVNNLLDLSVNGVNSLNSNGSVVKYSVFPLACSVDSVAKPKIVCQKQFNAYSGCLYCTHPNDSFIGNDKKLRFYDTSVTYELRTEESVIKDMMGADKLQRRGHLKDRSVNGFLGISILLMFSRLSEHFPSNTFNIVWSMVIDYLHCLLEGVAADLFGLIDSILTPEDLQKVNDRMTEITPTQAMTRRPRSFTERSYWKAKEYRAFLLYYALPLFEDILPKPNFSNLKLFVNAVHTLLSDNIASRDLSQVKTDLEMFVVGFQRLYGLQNVTYNLHLCSHLVDLVLQLGPLWSYSNFIFESGNGLLVRLVRGTKSIINEIALKFTTVRMASQFVLNHDISAVALKFCSELIGYHYTNNHVLIDGVHLTGSRSLISVTAEECELLEGRNVPVCNQQVLCYNRAIRNGIIICSRSYTKAKVYDDSCVRLKDGMYGVVDKIVKSSADEILCVFKPIRIADGSNIIASIFKCSHDTFGRVCVVPFKDIERKFMLISFENKRFVCRIPNFYERD